MHLAHRSHSDDGTIEMSLLLEWIEVLPMNHAYRAIIVSLWTLFFATCVIPVLAADGRPPGLSREAIKLPPPVYDGKISLERALKERRSMRQYANNPLILSDLSQLLWAAQGVSGSGAGRTVPSAGALYPLEVYVVVGNVSDLPDGIYRYEPQKHVLIKKADGDKRMELSRAALQSTIQNAPAILVFSGAYERTTAKYGARGIRYVHMEAGHASQNVYLQAVSLHLGTVVIGAFQDEDVRAVLALPENEQPLSIMPIGKQDDGKQ
jgi:SagB-type dehydrogenase family enzyme